MNVGEGPGKVKWSGRVRKIRGDNGWCDRQFFTNRSASVTIYVEERQPVGLVVSHLWFMLLLGITTLDTSVMSTRAVFTMVASFFVYQRPLLATGNFAICGLGRCFHSSENPQSYPTSYWCLPRVLGGQKATTTPRRDCVEDSSSHFQGFLGHLAGVMLLRVLGLYRSEQQIDGPRKCSTIWFQVQTCQSSWLLR